MPTITVDSLTDLLLDTLPDLDKGKVTNLTSDLQSYTALPQLLAKDRIKFKTGKSISVNIMTGGNGQFRFVGFGELDQYNDVSVLASGSIPWRRATSNYAYDLLEDDLNSDNERQILDHIVTKHDACYVDIANGLETAFWGKPATSADVKTAWGIDMYIVRNASQGFNGGNPAGFTTGTAFDSTVQTRYANWTDQYVAVSKADLLTRMRLATRKTNFKSPVASSQFRNTPVDRAIYTNIDVIQAMDAVLDTLNDNHGSDLAKFHDQSHFLKLPIVWVPQLDADTQDPVYGVDWATLVPFFKQGWHLKQSKPHAVANQHNVVAVDVDMAFNIGCEDRRRQWIINLA